VHCGVVSSPVRVLSGESGILGRIAAGALVSGGGAVGRCRLRMGTHPMGGRPGSPGSIHVQFSGRG
jgi:hypothetical protein